MAEALSNWVAAHFTALMWVSTAINLAAVYLTTRRIIWCWPVGFVGALLAAIVYWWSRLYSDMLLYGVYYAALQLYGWWAWLHGGAAGSPLPIRWMERRLLAMWIAGGAAATGLVGWFMATMTNAAVPVWDAGTTAFSMVAQILMTRKYIDNWVLWIPVNIVCVGLYIYRGLDVYAGLHVFYTILAVRGLVEWHRELRRG